MTISIINLNYVWIIKLEKTYTKSRTIVTINSNPIAEQHLHKNITPNNWNISIVIVSLICRHADELDQLKQEKKWYSTESPILVGILYADR